MLWSPPCVVANRLGLLPGPFDRNVETWIDLFALYDCIIKYKALCPAHPRMKLRLPRTNEDPQALPPGLAYDRELAARIHTGDRLALERFIERHTGTVYRYLIHRLGEGQDDLAHRLTAETLSDALGKLGRYARGTADTPVELWLLRVAERRLARSKLPRVPPLDQADEDERDVDSLRRVLSRVPSRYAFPVALAVFQQLTASEIAHALGTSQPGAMRRLRLALKRVGAELEREGL